MLKNADISLDFIFPLFVENKIDVVFLSPTETGMRKSILDATEDIRQFFVRNQIHDYSEQAKGQEHKTIIPAKLVSSDKMIDTKISVYRPQTKNGDPGIWIYKLQKFCIPNNLLALTFFNGIVYIFNLSDRKSLDVMTTSQSLIGNLFSTMSRSAHSASIELLEKLKEIHKMGFVPSEKHGDTCVGMTLEKLLGIPPNSDPHADYKGIELKSKRVVPPKAQTRQTIFSLAPDWERGPMNSLKVLYTFGYYDKEKKRQNLNCTIKNKINAQGLWLDVRETIGDLVAMGRTNEYSGDAALWFLEEIKKRVRNKHAEPFWIEASVDIRNNKEYFRYDKVIYTRKPQIEFVPSLLADDAIELDFLMHSNPTGSVRDHGFPFKMYSKKSHLLFPNEIHYDL